LRRKAWGQNRKKPKNNGSMGKIRKLGNINANFLLMADGISSKERGRKF